MRFNIQRVSRPVASLACAVLAASTLVGCGSSADYKPDTDAQHLAAYAAHMNYPADVSAMDNPKLTGIVDSGNNQLTIHNYSDGGVMNVNVWLNQAYVLHVDKIPAEAYRVFNLSDFYNSAGTNDLTGKDVKRVQVQTSDNKLMNVQGPQQM